MRYRRGARQGVIYWDYCDGELHWRAMTLKATNEIELSALFSKGHTCVSINPSLYWTLPSTCMKICLTNLDHIMGALHV